MLTFFTQLDKAVDKDLDVHVILDNLSAHKTAEIMAWLDDPRRKRWHLHFTPTSSSWTNLIERWFKEGPVDRRHMADQPLGEHHHRDALDPLG